MIAFPILFATLNHFDLEFLTMFVLKYDLFLAGVYVNVALDMSNQALSYYLEL